MGLMSLMAAVAFATGGDFKVASVSHISLAAYGVTSEGNNVLLKGHESHCHE